MISRFRIRYSALSIHGFARDTCLLCDESEEGLAWSDERTATALSCTSRTVARQGRRFINEGLDEALRIRRKSSDRLSKGNRSPSDRSGLLAAARRADTLDDSPLGR